MFTCLITSGNLFNRGIYEFPSQLVYITSNNFGITKCDRKFIINVIRVLGTQEVMNNTINNVWYKLCGTKYQPTSI